MAGRVIAVASMMLTAGCASILGIDEYAPSGASASSGAGGTGGTPSTSSMADGEVASSSASVGGSGGSACMGTLQCFGVLDTMGSAPCNDGPAVGTCVPPSWDYCGCSPAGAPFLYVEPGNGAPPTAITVMGNASDAPFSIEHSGSCIDDTTDDEPCTACQGRMLYRWTNLTQGGDLSSPGIKNLRLWAKDTNTRCGGDPGAVIININYEVL